ncbi:MAG: exo-beta-N-acetylmuramidase NamZ family protein [Candidatus Saccharicenans sp.]
MMILREQGSLTSSFRLLKTKKLTSAALLVFLLISLAVLGCCSRPAGEKPQEGAVVKPGVEVFLEKHLDLVAGKKVGLITNPSGVNRRLESTAWLFKQNPKINLVSLYGPEHGVRGNAQAGEYVPFYYDDKFGLPVFSLYGQTFRPVPGMFKNIDEYMRSFDTQHSGKIPEKNMVQEVEVMVFDIQDVGTRVYTYIATMAYAMEVCAELGIDFIVLDRPNPISGEIMEGAILKYPEFSSFVGLYPIPQRHGLTVGELARLFNDRFLKKKARLTVIPMEGWKRNMWFDQTGLPWVMPSPNMPTLETATVYPGQVYLEGTNVSEGRGTTRPFELFGAPWIDGFELTRQLNGLNLPGVIFRETWFTPVFSKYQGQLCGGCQLHVVDRQRFRPFLTSLWIIKKIMDLYPDKFSFYPEYFDKIMGNSEIRLALQSGTSPDQIVRELESGLKEFEQLRKNYLIY